ncbi:MAG TPA: formylglycine-generating enzyme family protein [Bacteroidales bacterium]|nr:formylglycine-generating enzyme family protein [Bacteroidales bacterium]
MAAKLFPTPKHITGDVGNDVSGGNKTATWNALEDMDKLQGEAIVFKVTAENSFMEMVYVKGGTFTMGCTGEQGGDCDDNEKPAHSVTVSSYYIGKYEVTQAQWEEIMGSNPSYYKGDNLPVESVSWYDIQEFIEKLNAKTGKNYRLPTEAEREFAARGGKQSKGYQYSGSNSLDSVAWYDDNSGGKTHPVGSKSPNELGIYDMSGNVWEWCSDWYSSYSSSSQTNPKGPQSGSDRVLRGGGWSYNARYCRVSGRNSVSPSYSYNDGDDGYGFRLVLSL